MTNHPGSKVVPHAPDLLRIIRQIRTDLQALRSRTRPETAVFAPADQTRGVPCTAASLTNLLETLVTRSGKAIYVDLAAWVGSSSVLEFRLSVPDLPATGAAVQTAGGATGEQLVRVLFTFPDAWAIGDTHLLYVQGRQVSGGDAATVRALRAVQR